MDINSQFDLFMKSTISNKWIGDNNLQIYVRKAFHTFCGEVIETIDIANIQQTEKSKGKGYFCPLCNISKLMVLQFILKIFLIQN